MKAVISTNRSEEEMLERRSFFGALAGASIGILSEGIFIDRAYGRSA